MLLVFSISMSLCYATALPKLETIDLTLLIVDPVGKSNTNSIAIAKEKE